MFCHIFEKYQGYFFAKKGGGGCFCQIRKLPGYFFKVERVGGGERHDFRKPIICAIKKVLAPPPRQKWYDFKKGLKIVHQNGIIFVRKWSKFLNKNGTIS